MLFLAIRMIF